MALNNDVGLQVGPKLNSFRQMGGSAVFAFPEFAYYQTYIQNQSNATYLGKDSINLLKVDEGSFQSFMNPINLKKFFDDYEKGNKAAIIKRFDLIDYKVVDSMYEYLHYIVDGWLNYKELNGTYH
jgi:hypothetical protein